MADCRYPALCPNPWCGCHGTCPYRRYLCPGSALIPNANDHPPHAMAPLTQNGRYRHWMAGLGVAVLGVTVSLWLAWQQADSVAHVGRARFMQEARGFADAQSQRIE